MRAHFNFKIQSTASSQKVILKANVISQNKQCVLCYKNIDLGNKDHHKSIFGIESLAFAYEFQETDK